MVTGSLQIKYRKNGKTAVYVVVNHKDNDGKWQNKWINTGLNEKQVDKLGKKKKEELIKQYVEQFEKDLKEQEQQQEQEQNSYAKRIEEYRNMPFLAFIKESLDEFKNSIAETTYDNWVNIYNNRMTNYFKPKKELQKLGKKIMNEEIDRKYYDKEPTITEISQLDINDLYNWLYACGLKGSSIDKFHVVFNKVFKRAIRLQILKRSENPMLDIEKPKIQPFIGQFYSPQEMNDLFELLKDSNLQVPILLAGYYGLRRSEVLGLKWDAIDWENESIIIRHTVTKVKRLSEKIK